MLCRRRPAPLPGPWRCIHLLRLLRKSHHQLIRLWWSILEEERDSLYNGFGSWWAKMSGRFILQGLQVVLDDATTEEVAGLKVQAVDFFQPQPVKGYVFVILIVREASANFDFTGATVYYVYVECYMTGLMRCVSRSCRTSRRPLPIRSHSERSLPRTSSPARIEYWGRGRLAGYDYDGSRGN